MNLIERLEAATEGSRELDAEIWCSLKGYKYLGIQDAGHGWGACPHHDQGDGVSWRTSGCPHYTTSLGAALTLVEKGEWWDLSVNLDDREIAEAEVGGCSGDNQGQSSTPALAICIAARKARAI